MADELGDDIAEFAVASRNQQRAAEGEVFFGTSAPLNADDANRMLRKLRAFERQHSEIHERYLAEKQMLDAWVADRLSGVEREMAELHHALEGWMRGVHALSGTLTEKLPAGELRLRQGTPSVVVGDEAAAVRWLDGHGMGYAVAVKESVAKAAVGDDVMPGEKVPGDAGPDHEFRQAVYVNGDGERQVIDGLLLRVPSRRTFKAALNKEAAE